jgi:hypothetical protein
MKSTEAVVEISGETLHRHIGKAVNRLRIGLVIGDVDRIVSIQWQARIATSRLGLPIVLSMSVWGQTWLTQLEKTSYFESQTDINPKIDSETLKIYLTENRLWRAEQAV